MLSRNGKRGKWRIIYKAYGQLQETDPMSKREARDYFEMARCNCLLGHWDWIEMVRVKKGYSDGKPLALRYLLRAAKISDARQLAHSGEMAKTVPAVAT